MRPGDLGKEGRGKTRNGPFAKTVADLKRGSGIHSPALVLRFGRTRRNGELANVPEGAC
jgi:hypothetical protein